MLLDRIQKHVESMEQAADFTEDLQKRAKLLSQCAEFREDSDAVPIADSVAGLPRFESNGVDQDSEVNILGENYWAIASTLSR